MSNVAAVSDDQLVYATDEVLALIKARPYKQRPWKLLNKHLISAGQIEIVAEAGFAQVPVDPDDPAAAAVQACLVRHGGVVSAKRLLAETGIAVWELCAVLEKAEHRLTWSSCGPIGRVLMGVGAC